MSFYELAEGVEQEPCEHACNEDCDPCRHEHCWKCGGCECPGYCDDYQTYNLRPAETGGAEAPSRESECP